MPYDITALVRLEAEPDNTPPELRWIHDSARDPAPFWQALMDTHAASYAPRAVSRFGDHYDLYADMVIRHLGQSAPAFRWFERGALQSLSYPELHARTTRAAGAWAGQKVKPGDVIAILLPVGPAWLVAVLTALRMGLVLSWLPPLGDWYLQKRLAGLDPKHVVTEPLYRPMLGPFDERALGDGPAAAYPHRWHVYGPQDPCARLFTPLREPLDKPVELGAEAAYLRAVRDAVFAFRLSPGATLGAPGFDELQHQPALVFAALLAGATYVHLSVDDVEVAPQRLTDLSFRAMGVTVAVRDALLGARPGRKGAWDHWFKNPEEAFDPQAWRAFVTSLGLDKTPASNVLIDAAAGGASLFSVCRPGGTDLRLVPAPGAPYALYDLNESGDEAPGAIGLFAPKPTDKPAAEGHVILAQWGLEYLYSGTPSARRDGRVYPADDVAGAIADLPFVEGALVVPVASGGVPVRSLFMLLVFTGAERPEDTAKQAAARSEAIERQIIVRLGRDARPDQIAFFPLYPRLDEGAIDKKWSETQYRTGRLSRKAKNPVFVALTALRKAGVKDLSQGMET